MPLTEARQIPSGSQIDALEGSLKIVTAAGQVGKTQNATLAGVVFTLTQARSGTRRASPTSRSRKAPSRAPPPTPPAKPRARRRPIRPPPPASPAKPFNYSRPAPTASSRPPAATAQPPSAAPSGPSPTAATAPSPTPSATPSSSKTSSATKASSSTPAKATSPARFAARSSWPAPTARPHSAVDAAHPTIRRASHLSVSLIDLHLGIGLSPSETSGLSPYRPRGRRCRSSRPHGSEQQSKSAPGPPPTWSRGSPSPCLTCRSAWCRERRRSP